MVKQSDTNDAIRLKELQRRMEKLYDFLYALAGPWPAPSEALVTISGALLNELHALTHQFGEVKLEAKDGKVTLPDGRVVELSDGATSLTVPLQLWSRAAQFHI